MLGGVHLLLHQTDETYWPSVYETGHSLSLINRWAGWTCRPYSVAQHAVVVSYVIEQLFGAQWALAGLHHDDHECLVGDISSPLKREMKAGGWSPAYLTSRVDAQIERRLNIDMTSREAGERVLAADILVTAFEAVHLVRAPEADVWRHFDSVAELDGTHVEATRPLALKLMNAMSWAEARMAYVDRHHQLVQIREKST
jgi:hypothetical protein